MNPPKIDFQPLIRMRDLLQKSLLRLETEKLDELGQMGVIQAFEVSYELVWKILQKILNQQGVEARSPRETFRLAAQFGYLDNPQTWLGFGQERNLASHAYREEILHELLNLLPQFIPELTKIINNLQAKEELN